MSRNRRDGDGRARGNRHTVGKCERAQRETAHGDWEETESGSVSRTWGAEEGPNELAPIPSSRWVSRRKLSILYILSIPAFIQPSSLITASTSSRRGSRYSGWARRRYKICVTVYERTMSRTASQGETEARDLPETSNEWLPD